MTGFPRTIEQARVLFSNKWGKIKPDVILDPSALIPPTLDTSADTTVDTVDPLLTPDMSTVGTRKWDNTGLVLLGGGRS